MLSGVYGAVAARRRRWYEARPDLRRRLRQPVVSVGSLTIGGSGKTPVVADVAAVLVSLGERPAVLSRGYGRQNRRDGVVVVSENGIVKADVAQAGDEPLMLANRLSHVSVVVSDDRYLAGRFAESRLGASVHVLDDGFQHLSLGRDVDLLILSEDDVVNPRTLPGGRLREPLETARRADALIAEAANLDQALVLAERLAVREGFFFARELGTPKDETSQELAVSEGARVLAVAGIARPERFVDALRTKGYDVVDLMTYGDHHPFSSRDLSAIGDRAQVLGVNYVVTTEKDFVKVRHLGPFGVPWACVPLTVSVQPADRFRAWLADRVVAAREQGRAERG